MTPFQISELRKWYDIFKDNHYLVELRLIDPQTSKTYSGYFEDVDTIIKALEPYEHCNQYFVLNRIDERLYKRQQKDHFVCKPKETTSDKDIEGYDWIMIDIDVERPSGITSSDEELNYAKKKANEVYAYLRDANFEKPVVCCSGSGVHVMYKVALANDEENRKLIKNFLDALGMMFSDEKVHIDSVVGNPARLCRLYGSVNRKGANTEERPHRLAYIVKAPDEIKPTDIEYIRKVASLIPEPEAPSRQNHYRGTDSFDLEAFIAKYNIKVAKKTATNDYTKYVLAECPFDANHKAPDSCVFAFRNGGYQFVCLHQSHRHLTFKDFRLHFDPNAYDKATFADHVYRQNYYRVRPMFEPEPVTQDKGNPWKMMSEIKKTELSPNDYIPTGIKTLDDIVIGQKLGQVTVWSGRRGCAKSTLLNQVLLGSANRGARCALISRELSEGETKQWMMLQLAGKQYNQKSRFNDFYFTPNPIVERIEPWIDQYLRIYNNTYKGDILNLEDKIRQLYAEWPFQILALDNLMTIELDDLGERNEWDNQKKLLNKLTALARELKCHIHLVAHPNKQRQWLDCDSISGSGSIANYAQNVLIVHRIYPDTFESQAAGSLSKDKIADIQTSGCTNIVEIAKWRDKGSAMGKIIKLWFEVESNRLKSDPYEVITYNWQEQATQTSIDIIGDMPNYEIDGFPTKNIDDDWLKPMGENEVVPF